MLVVLLFLVITLVVLVIAISVVTIVTIVTIVVTIIVIVMRMTMTMAMISVTVVMIPLHWQPQLLRQRGRLKILNTAHFMQYTMSLIPRNQLILNWLLQQRKHNSGRHHHIMM